MTQQRITDADGREFAFAGICTSQESTFPLVSQRSARRGVAAGHGLARGLQGNGLARRARAPARPAAARPAPVPSAGGSRRTGLALGTGAGPAAAGRAGALALRVRPWLCGPRARPWPAATPRLALHCEKTLTYLRRAYVSVNIYSLEVFPVSSLE